jgi:hypothetical protein
MNQEEIMLIAGLLIGGVLTFLIVSHRSTPPKNLAPRGAGANYFYVSPRYAKALASGENSWVPIFTKSELDDGSQGSILRLEPSDVESEPVVASQPRSTPA